MSTAQQLIGVILFLHVLYFLNRERKPYFFGLTPNASIIKNQLTKGILISLYLFIAVAALGALAQDLYQSLN